MTYYYSIQCTIADTTNGKNRLRRCDLDCKHLKPVFEDVPVKFRCGCGKGKPLFQRVHNKFKMKKPKYKRTAWLRNTISNLMEGAYYFKEPMTAKEVYDSIVKSCPRSIPKHKSVIAIVIRNYYKVDTVFNTGHNERIGRYWKQPNTEEQAC